MHCSLSLPSELMMIEVPTYQTDEWNIDVVNAWFAIETTEMLNFDCIFQINSTVHSHLYSIFDSIDSEWKEIETKKWRKEWKTLNGVPEMGRYLNGSLT